MPTDRPVSAALLILIVLQIIMLASLFARVPPHPPAATPLFGIGPFIGVSQSIALAALVLDPACDFAGRVLAGLACVLALVSFGPQKYPDPQFPLIWPAVLCAQAAVAVIALRIISLRGAERPARA